MVLFSAVAGLCYEQDMIVEAVAFLLNLPDLQVEDLESEAIMNDLKEALASGAGVTEDLVHILGVYAGSVVVDSQIVFPEAHRDAAVSFREALETNAVTEVFKDGALTLGLTAATVVRNHQYLGHRTACVMFLLWVCTLQALQCSSCGFALQFAMFLQCSLSSNLQCSSCGFALCNH